MYSICKSNPLSLVIVIALFISGINCFASGNAGGLSSSLKEGMVVLYYFVSDQTTTVSVVTNDGVQTTSRIIITQGELAEQVRGFREEIKAPPLPEQAATSYLSALEKGHDLYDLLIAPVEEYLINAVHLVIVPSDVLFYLPFGALVNCPGCEARDLYGGKFMIEEYSISYVPNLRSLEVSLQDTRTEGARSILAVCNAEYSASCESEVKHIAALFPERTVLIGAEASPEAIIHLLKGRKYDVVHLAARSLSLDAQAPLLSGVSLLSGEDREDILQIAELLGLGKSISLLTFSMGLMISSSVEGAFADNAMKASTGDAFGHLADGILASGIASTVMYPWGSVNCLAAEKFMEVMYQELERGSTKDEALQQAKLSFIHNFTNLPYRYPCYWAPFVLYGNFSAINLALPPDTGKLDYSLYQALQEWKTSGHAADATSPFVSVVVTLSRLVTNEDLETMGALSDEIAIQGAFGSFVQLRLPLEMLDAVCALEAVRSVTTPTGTIMN